MKKSTASETSDVATKYVKAFAKGNHKQLRSLLADRGTFGVSGMSADAYVESVRKGGNWKDVKVVKTVVSEGEAALLYEGTNAETGQRMQAYEFVEVSGGQIQRVRGSILVLAGALAGVEGFSLTAMAVAI